MTEPTGAPVETDEHLLARLKREREWGQTDIGSAFVRFENALGNAWSADSNPNASDRRLREVWARANKARADFLLLLRGW